MPPDLKPGPFDHSGTRVYNICVYIILYIKYKFSKLFGRPPSTYIHMRRLYIKIVQ